ncbi:hypothetical protein tloyanaT_24600 [Thalassotalea loyana]|uniref:SDR family NAD(P)-dependent oxidoreductase n=1 Tax=Thalassotalea loyana TaxID=280483 RepID=A0ABQ6HHJ9_9GAMM|nr:SDR family NAD(P)-dependent oxidoreductase [Thalassotalea loyana]GLX86207.1 hypothetical protein tloyanaT_24600 [Thalassotalea loyana]
MIEKVLITGANAGLGKEAAKQLAEQSDITKIYLGCRNRDKAIAAKRELEAMTQRKIFEILLIDVSNLDSVKQAVSEISEPIDALIMNAGGTGGANFNRVNQYGATEIFSANMLGHAQLAQQLINEGKLTQIALYAGSEAARGVEEMGMKRPNLNDSSIDEFAAIINGTKYPEAKDPTISYGPIKYMGALWMSAMARKHSTIRFITMSPGATTGTEGFNTLPLVKQWVMKGMMQVMQWAGKVHGVEQGAARYIDGLYNLELKSGGFYASQKGLSGPIDDQSKLFPDIGNTNYQDNAYQAIQRFL